jgi:hypothetical protein
MNKQAKKISGIAALVSVAALLVCGCSDHPDAGTVDMSAAKKAAAERGILEANSPGPVKGAATTPKGRDKGQLPTKALAKGGR